LVGYKLVASELLASLQNVEGKSGLEFALVHCGIFMDFFCYPRQTYLKAGFPLVVDLDHSIAALPGNGDKKVVFTHTFDVAASVVAMLALEAGKWEEHMYVVGEKLSWKEIVQLVEDAKGKTFPLYI
jgi:nucleoside-diphosphate-sugar epimerase